MFSKTHNKKSKKIQNKTLRKTNKNPNKKPNKTTKGGRKLRRSEQQLFDDVVDTIEEILAGLDRNISYCNEKLNKINNSISQIENKIYELEKETKKVKGEQYVLLDLINNNDMGIDERKDIWDEIGVYNEILDLLYEDTTMALKNYSVFLEIEKKIRNYRNSFIRTKDLFSDNSLTELREVTPTIEEDYKNQSLQMYSYMMMMKETHSLDI